MRDKLINDLINQYSKTWDLLLKFDNDDLNIPSGKIEKLERLDIDFAKAVISEFKNNLIAKQSATNLFGYDKNNSLNRILNAIYQTFDGKELYLTIEEKGAHLLYFIIKDHPFTDGNKRIACLLFLIFLKINNYNNVCITAETLTTIALLIATSDASAKDTMIKLIINLCYTNN